MVPSFSSRPSGIRKVSTVVRYWPTVAVTPPPERSSLSRMLITPAIASEPYNAEAPSRSTSTRSIAEVGMAFRSTAAEPRPMEPLTLTSAV